MVDKNKIMKTVVQLAGNVDPSLAKSIQEAQVKIGGLNLKAIAIGAAFTAGVAIAVKEIADMGKALYDLGAQFDDAYDTIRIGTGATGEALEDLKDTFKDVYGSVPTSMEDAGKAISDYNTRLGLTDDQLGALSKQAIAASNMLGEDLGGMIEYSSQAFQQWNIQAGDMSDEMDRVFKVSQATGMSMSELFTDLQAYGPQLQSLGYNFGQSAAMIGQMEKAGLNTNEVLGALKKSVGVFAKEGLSATNGIKKYYEAIKNAKSETEAASLANEVFGKRAGSTMASAIRKGALEIDAFTEAIDNSDESIMKAMWDTADAKEKFGLLQQQFQLMIEPLASGIFDDVAEFIPVLSDLFKDFAPILSQVVQQIKPMVDLGFKALGDILKDLGPLFADISAELLPPLLEIAEAILPAVVELVRALCPIIKVLATVIGADLSGVLSGIVPIFKDLMGILTNLLSFIGNVFTGQWKAAWTNIVNIVKDLFKGIADIIKAPFKIASTTANKIASSFGKKNKNGTVELPAYASGGFTNGLSIAGEAGTEAIISFDPAYRSNNISTWLKAGEMLGVASSSGNSYNLGGFSFSPNIYISERMSSQEIINKIKSAEGEFMDIVDEFLQRQSANSYLSPSNAY